VSEKSAVVVIPTIGGDTLEDAIDSVLAQTYKNVSVLVVVDGYANWNRTGGRTYRWIEDKRVRFTYLHDSTGKVGDQRFWGHRIYAASPHITNEDYVFFLDDDNWYQPDHVESLIDLCERQSLHCAFSMRNIYKADKTFYCEDRCESLGFHFVWGDHKRGCHVDTSSWCFNRQALIAMSVHWHGGYAQDRLFLDAMKRYPNIRWGTTGKFTLNYRLGSTDTSPAEGFFQLGNQVAQKTIRIEERTNV
jgi:glycosyltransferase involved in cell wall biosynthesis